MKNDDHRVFEFPKRTNEPSNPNLNNNQTNYVPPQAEILSKEEAVKRILKNVDDMSKSPLLPPINISEREWKVFFNVIYNHFNASGIEDNYYPIVLQVINYALPMCIGRYSEITIDTLVSQMDMPLRMCRIPEEMLTSIRREIMVNAHNDVINIDDYRRLR